MSDQIKRDQDTVALRQLIEETYGNNPEALNALRANADALDSELRQLPAGTSPAVAIDHLTTHQWFREAAKPEVNLGPTDQLPAMRESQELLPFDPPNLGSVIGTGTDVQAHASTTHQPFMAAPVNSAHAEPSIGKVPEGSLAERVRQTLERNAELREAATSQQSIVLQHKNALIESFIVLRELLIEQSNNINALGLTSQRLTYLPKEDSQQRRWEDWFFITFAGHSLRVSLETDKLHWPTNAYGRIGIVIADRAPEILLGPVWYYVHFNLHRDYNNTLSWRISEGPHYRIRINWGDVASWLLEALMQRDFIARSVNPRNNKPTLLPPYTAY